MATIGHAAAAALGVFTGYAVYKATATTTQFFEETNHRPPLDYCDDAMMTAVAATSVAAQYLPAHEHFEPSTLAISTSTVITLLTAHDVSQNEMKFNLTEDQLAKIPHTSKVHAVVATTLAKAGIAVVSNMLSSYMSYSPPSLLSTSIRAISEVALASAIARHIGKRVNPDNIKA